MPETTYVPDPRAQPLIFPPSREFDCCNGESAVGSSFTSDQLIELRSLSGPIDGLSFETFDEYAVGSISAFDGGSGWAANGVGSGCSIVSRTSYGTPVVTQNRLSIVSGQYGRQFAFGDSWGRLRIGMLWRINHGATFGPSAFYFGVCSGTTNMAASATTDNFAGIRAANSGGTDATLTAGTRMSYFDFNPAVRFASRRATTNTDRGSGAGSTGRMVAQTEGWVTLFLMEMSRPTFANDASSVNYSFGFARSDATTVEMSYAKRVLFDALVSNISSSLASADTWTTLTAAAATIATPYAFDQSTGKLDTVNVTWDQAFGMELSAIGARKVY